MIQRTLGQSVKGKAVCVVIRRIARPEVEGWGKEREMFNVAGDL